MQVASKNLCQELYELTGWEYTEERRRIDKVWIQSFSTSEMGQGNDDYEKTPPEKRRQYHIGDWVVRDNPKNFIGVPEDVPWGWANKYYQQTIDVSFPAYDLGWLMRKLQQTPTACPEIQDEPHVAIEHTGVVKPEYRWTAKIYTGIWRDKSAPNPEDAAIKLLITLVKKRIIK